MGDPHVHDGPKALDGIEVGARRVARSAVSRGAQGFQAMVEVSCPATWLIGRSVIGVGNSAVGNMHC